MHDLSDLSPRVTDDDDTEAPSTLASHLLSISGGVIGLIA